MVQLQFVFRLKYITWFTWALIKDSGFDFKPKIEKYLFPGHPYLLLFKCLSISHLRLKGFPHEGHLEKAVSESGMLNMKLIEVLYLWVPLCICLWCCKDPGCLNTFSHLSQMKWPWPSAPMLNPVVYKKKYWLDGIDESKNFINHDNPNKISAPEDFIT